MYRLVKFSPGGGDLADVTVLQPTGHLAIWGILGGCAEGVGKGWHAESEILAIASRIIACKRVTSCHDLRIAGRP